MRRRQLAWGSNLFHIGILGIFFGHFVGLLTPMEVWHALGVTAPAKQILAIVAGGIAGLLCLGYPEEPDDVPELERKGWQARLDGHAHVSER